VPGEEGVEIGIAVGIDVGIDVGIIIGPPLPPSPPQLTSKKVPIKRIKQKKIPLNDFVKKNPP